MSPIIYCTESELFGLMRVPLWVGPCLHFPTNIVLANSNNLKLLEHNYVLFFLPLCFACTGPLPWMFFPSCLLGKLLLILKLSSDVCNSWMPSVTSVIRHIFSSCFYILLCLRHGLIICLLDSFLWGLSTTGTALCSGSYFPTPTTVHDISDIF